MNVSRLALLILSISPLFLFSQTWTYTPADYPTVCTNPAVAGQWTMDYAAATNQAAHEGKDLYVMIVGSTWCPDCNGLEKQVLNQAAFKAFMAQSEAYWVWLDFPNRKATNATAYAWLCHTNTGLFTLEASEALLARNRQIESAYAVYKQYRSPTTINMPTVLVLKPDGSYQGEVTHYRQLTNVTAEAFIAKIGRAWNDDAWDVQDNRVPGKSDDDVTTATPVTNLSAVAVRQAHTLSPSDAADWYRFTALPGKTYHFVAEGRLLDGQAALPLPEVGVSLYTASNGVPVAQATAPLGSSPSLAWTWNQATPQTCYVKVAGAFDGRAGYDLVYSETTDATPAQVRFLAAAVTNSETAASVTLRVALASPCTAEGGVRVFFSTRPPAQPAAFGTAAPGQDYLAVVSNEVVWTRDEAMQQTTKLVTVPLVQDLHPTWEGDETFGVVIEDGLNSAVAADGAQATVVLKESAKREAGSVGFSAQGASAAPFANLRKPAVVVREGDDLVLWVDRMNGRDGEVAATVETVAGTALPGAAFTPQSVTLTWPDGDDAPRQVLVGTLADAAYADDLAFEVRVASTSAAGIVSGRGVVAVTLRDQLVAHTLGEGNAAGLTFTAAGAATWFVGAAGERRCEPVPAGQNATLKTTVKGPGRLSFDWTFLPAVDAASRLVVRVGGETRTFLAGAAESGSELFTVASAGAQTVSWQIYADGAQPQAVSIGNVVWRPLQRPVGPVPALGFVCTDAPAQLMWDDVPAADEYRLYMGYTQSTMGRILADQTITGNHVTPCLDCLLFKDVKYYWRVDAVMALPGGGEVVVKGNTWTFSIKSWDGPVTELPAFDETEGLQLTADGAYRLVAGVQYALGPFPMVYDCGGCGDDEPSETKPLTYTLSGKLPAGLAMKTVDGASHFVGIPTQAGEFDVWVQSHSAVEGVSQIGSTYPVAFSVVPLGKAAGTFNGWTAHSSEATLNGAITLTVSGSGKLSAKVRAAGQTLSFSRSGYAAETNGIVYVRLETKGPKTVAGAVFTNALDLAISMATGEGTGTFTLAQAVKDEDGRIVDGATSTSEVRLFRNSWGEAAFSELAQALEGYYTVALPVVGPSANAPLGSGTLTMTVSANGSVKLAGVLGDGASWSAAGVLLAEDLAEGAAAKAGAAPEAYLWLYATPSAYRNAGAVCGLLRFVWNDDAGRFVVVADGQLPFLWWNWAVKSVYDAAPEDDSTGFLSALDASGGYYDTLMNLQTWYLGQTLTFGAFGEALAAPAAYNGTDDATSGYALLDQTPEGLQLTVLAQTLSVPGKVLAYIPAGDRSGAIDFGQSVNPNGISLRYTRATGLITGSFTLYYQSGGADQAYKTRSVTYKGVMTPLREAGGAWASTEAQGFYLVPDARVYLGGAGKTLSYTFNRSYRLTVEAAP